MGPATNLYSMFLLQRPRTCEFEGSTSRSHALTEHPEKPAERSSCGWKTGSLSTSCSSSDANLIRRLCDGVKLSSSFEDATASVGALFEVCCKPFLSGLRPFGLVDEMGFEPTTSSLRTRKR